MPHVNLLKPGCGSRIWYGSLCRGPCIWNGLDHQHFVMDREQWNLSHLGHGASPLNWATPSMYLQRQAMTWHKERRPPRSLSTAVHFAFSEMLILCSSKPTASICTSFDTGTTAKASSVIQHQIFGDSCGRLATGT